MSRAFLSVSIVGGPSAPALLREMAKTNANIRLGLLNCSNQNEDPAKKSELTNLFIEELARPREGDAYDPARIAAQIRAIADREVVDHLLLECDADTPAMAFASLFVPQRDAPHPLAEVARLTTNILAIAPFYLLDGLVSRRDTADLFSPCFIAEQLEFASVVILEGARSDPGFELALEIVTTLNPCAEVFELSQDRLERLLGETDRSFDFAAALDGAGWRKLIDGKSDQRQSNVSAFAFHSRKPFHPERFWNLLQGGLPRVFRAKGFFWLATRMELAGGLNLAGAESHCAAAGNWWAARDDHVRQLQMPDRTRREWREPFGDRRQALAFMGVDLDPDSLRSQLDACLLTDSEAAARPEAWQALIDPFPPWSHHRHDHDHGCDHGHESHEHDCCHH